MSFMKQWAVLVVLILCTINVLAALPSPIQVSRARTPWSVAPTSSSLSSSTSSSASNTTTKTSSVSKSYAGESCKVKKNSKDIQFKGRHMVCAVSEKDSLGNHWSCLSDAKTMRCGGNRCPYSQCGILGR